MTWIYEWIKTIVFYYIFVSMITNALPEMKYQNYIKYFLGILFIVILLDPILDFLSLTEVMDASYLQELMELEMERMENEIQIIGR